IPRIPVALSIFSATPTSAGCARLIAGWVLRFDILHARGVVQHLAGLPEHPRLLLGAVTTSDPRLQESPHVVNASVESRFARLFEQAKPCPTHLAARRACIRGC